MNWKEIIFKCVVLLLVTCSVTEGLQCFNCRGMTKYDPDLCETPEYGRTIIQECGGDDICEKKIHHIDRWHHVVSRGCSSNCNDREYIYTDDFQVHCCSDNICNSGHTLLYTYTTLLSGLVGAFYMVL